MSVGPAIRCPGCGRAYAPTRFASGRVIDCACGARVGPALIDRTLPRRGDTRFFADAMLGRLARWLRVLGFDTAYVTHIADADLVRRAIEQDRVILTRDRRLPDMDRRRALGITGATALGALALPLTTLAARTRRQDESMQNEPTPITMFLCGDVMTGRGIDQILPHPGNPRLYEEVVKDARRYVKLAETANGPVTQPVDFAYIWGDALDELARARPDARIINLETAVTSGGDPWAGKGIHYRMHPRNVPCLTAAGIDACALANNHVLDWGYAGLTETLDVLGRAGLATTGAGLDRDAAEAPVIIDVAGKGRVIVLSFGTGRSGIPGEWAAGEDRAGVARLGDLSSADARRIAARVRAVKRAGDVVVVSLHWGGNWGYEIPRKQRAFVHGLIAAAGVDVVHGHSSHHPRGIEVHRGKLIMYGCGDFINDYEGIAGYEKFRDDLGFMYFASVDPASGALVQLRMVPTQIRRLQVRRASLDDARWLLDMLNREGEKLGTRAVMDADGALSLRWA